MPKPAFIDVTEQKRLNDAREAGIPWKKWGPYLSERQWGTVREDYSEDGNAWDYFSHDQSRSRAYRWGEDGLGGISDDKQRLCFALALWNERDPILKERLFGLTNSEGNHGEDVKEYYFYIDSTPTHSYMKYLLQVSAAGVPVSGPRRDEPRSGRARSSSTSCSTPASSTTTGTSTCSWSTPRPARRTSSSGSPFTTAGRKRPGSACCRRCGSGTRGRGVRTIDKPAAARGGARRHRGVASRARPVRAVVRRGAGAAVHREREQRPASLGPAERLALRQGRVPRLRRLGTAATR